ncbi:MULTISPECIES: hypothetical protein [Gammaproteobacteria]|uniref:hypothetical protein n=1 Tax=Gammaproteobacteria TaxID=1236 RepID=UPI000788584C|nr:MULTISPECIES: hypothetical protein [Gammaproteobacteria]
MICHTRRQSTIDVDPSSIAIGHIYMQEYSVYFIRKICFIMGANGQNLGASVNNNASADDITERFPNALFFDTT